MATTIIAQPQQLMPAYNPIKYIIDNTDKNGLVEVVFIEVEGPTQEELIAQKEAQLLALYEELKSYVTATNAGGSDSVLSSNYAYIVS